jgi:hypothetical protein
LGRLPLARRPKPFTHDLQRIYQLRPNELARGGDRFRLDAHPLGWDAHTIEALRELGQSFVSPDPNLTDDRADVV